MNQQQHDVYLAKAKQAEERALRSIEQTARKLVEDRCQLYRDGKPEETC
jgi:hypothetical protein